MFALPRRRSTEVAAPYGSSGMSRLCFLLRRERYDAVEKIQLMTAQQAFSAATRVIQVSSEMLQTTNDIFS